MKDGRMMNYSFILQHAYIHNKILSNHEEFLKMILRYCSKQCYYINLSGVKYRIKHRNNKLRQLQQNYLICVMPNRLLPYYYHLIRN